MHAILIRSIYVAVSFYLLGLSSTFISTVWATEGLASQKSRFEGMGATFKAKKKAASAADSSMSAENKTSEDDEALDENTSDDDSASYFKLHTFVVNVVDKRDEDKLLFLTLEVFCEIKQTDDRWLIDTHIAPIKDTIITYISGLNRQTIQTQKQKKALQKELTLRVSNTLKKLTGKNVVSELYLTRIIIQ